MVMYAKVVSYHRAKSAHTIINTHKVRRSKRTSVNHQQWRQMILIFGENVDKFIEIGNASSSQKLEKFVVAVTWLRDVLQVFFLRRRDTFDSSKLIE